MFLRCRVDWILVWQLTQVFICLTINFPITIHKKPLKCAIAEQIRFFKIVHVYQTRNVYRFATDGYSYNNMIIVQSILFTVNISSYYFYFENINDSFILRKTIRRKELGLSKYSGGAFEKSASIKFTWQTR